MEQAHQPPPLRLRNEEPADAAAIGELLRAAFAGLAHSDQTEHLIVAGLRARGRLALSMVAQVGDTPVGHVAFSPVAIDGVEDGWYGLGPLAVLPARQGAGIGARLVEGGLAALRARGARGCVVLGEPAYYTRFGFAAHALLRYPGPPPEYFMAQSFAGPVPAGVVAYDAAFG